MIAFQSVGVSLLFVMGLFPSIWTVRWLILPVYILRTMANNCCYAIIRSLLMDYVPKVGLLSSQHGSVRFVLLRPHGCLPLTRHLITQPRTHFVATRDFADIM